MQPNEPESKRILVSNCELGVWPFTVLVHKKYNPKIGDFVIISGTLGKFYTAKVTALTSEYAGPVDEICGVIPKEHDKKAVIAGTPPIKPLTLKNKISNLLSTNSILRETCDSTADKILQLIATEFTNKV